MVDQKAMNRSANKAVEPSGSVSESLADFVDNLAELGDLQLRLLRQDARASFQHARFAIVLFGLGLCAILAGIMLALLGLVEELAAHAVMSRPAAFLTVGLGALLFGALAFQYSLGRIASSSEGFRRSNEELIRNLSWVRTVLTQSGRSRVRR